MINSSCEFSASHPSQAGPDTLSSSSPERSSDFTVRPGLAVFSKLLLSLHLFLLESESRSLNFLLLEMLQLASLPVSEQSISSGPNPESCILFLSAAAVSKWKEVSTASSNLSSSDLFFFLFGGVSFSVLPETLNDPLATEASEPLGDTSLLPPLLVLTGTSTSDPEGDASLTDDLLVLVLMGGSGSDSGKDMSLLSLT